MAKKMIKNKAKDFFSRVIHSWQYWLVFVIFVLVILFGKNIPANIILSAGDVSALQSAYGMEHEIASTSANFTLSGVLDSLAGDSYRIDFEASADRSDVQDFPQSEPPDSAAKIDVMVQDAVGGEKKIGSFDLPVNLLGLDTKSIIFTADGRYKNIIFSKSDDSDTAAVTIRNVKIARLNNPNNLMPTISGNPVIEAISNGSVADTSFIYDMTRKHTLVGQIFQSKYQFLSAVDLKLHFMQGGGYGQYGIVVREAKKVGSNFIVSKNNLTELLVTSTQSENALEKDSTNEIFHFPVAAKLTPGQYYFVGTTDEGVRIDLLHHLKLGGFAGQKDGTAGVVQSDGTLNPINNLFLTVYGGQLPSVSGATTLFGATIRDMGDGLGKYVYSLDRNYLTGLDEFSKESHSIVYKFDTVYPFTTFYIDSAVDPTNLSDYGVEYSFDQKVWQKISEPDNQAETGIFQKRISGDGSNHIAYLRFNFDGVADKNFSKLNINADLRLK